MTERATRETGERRGTGKARPVELPDRAEIRRGPLGRLCDLLGLTPVRNDLELLRLVENGLPADAVRAFAAHVQEAKAPAGEITDMVIPRRTLDHRRKGNQPLSRDESDRLVRIARVIALSEQVFADTGKAVSWLRRPKRSLGGESPLKALATETGARMVEAMLHQIDHGITA